MGLRHREHDVEGVQFHPESVLTREGKRLVGNWLKLVAARAARAREPASREPERERRLRQALGEPARARAPRRRRTCAPRSRRSSAGAWTPVQIGAFAVALRMPGETPEAIAGRRARRCARR